MKLLPTRDTSAFTLINLADRQKSENPKKHGCWSGIVVTLESLNHAEQKSG